MRLVGDVVHGMRRGRTWNAVGAFILPFAIEACADDPADPAVAPVLITTSSLPSGVLATPYTATLTAVGGTANYTWSVTSGALPSGLPLSSSGTIAGMPSAGGVYTFTGRVSSGSQGDTRDLAILISNPPRLRWPLEGANCVDWVVNNCVDLDSTGGLRDYTGSTGGSAKTYDTHAGVDIDVPNFRWMDSSLSPVHAAAAGVVTATHDGEWDRNMSCTGVANMVTIRHADGRRAIYDHFKRGSLTVAVGQSVLTGDRIGLVGSSGCSTAPHLLFELRAVSNRVIDPFQSGLWIDHPLVFTGARRHGFYYWNASLAAVGSWTASVFISGVLLRTYPVSVTP